MDSVFVLWQITGGSIAGVPVQVFKTAKKNPPFAVGLICCVFAAATWKMLVL